MMQKSKKAGIPVSEASGKIAPKSISISSTEDVLRNLNDLFDDLDRSRYQEYDRAYRMEPAPACKINCLCPPCLSGLCSNCVVDEANLSTDERLAAAQKYRSHILLKTLNGLRGL